MPKLRRNAFGQTKLSKHITNYVNRVQALIFVVSLVGFVVSLVGFVAA
ncbi:hypothetical protein ACMDZ0_000478 [Enterococcus hirae]|nr:hypothetical protein [Enterococcus hirae]